jgi:hypothetical protein
MCFETAILVLEQVKERVTALLLNIIAALLVMLLPSLHKWKPIERYFIKSFQEVPRADTCLW